MFFVAATAVHFIEVFAKYNEIATIPDRQNRRYKPNGSV